MIIKKYTLDGEVHYVLVCTDSDLLHILGAWGITNYSSRVEAIEKNHGLEIPERETEVWKKRGHGGFNDLYDFVTKEADEIRNRNK